MSLSYSILEGNIFDKDSHFKAIEISKKIKCTNKRKVNKKKINYYYEKEEKKGKKNTSWERQICLIYMVVKRNRLYWEVCSNFFYLEDGEKRHDL